MTSAVTCPEFQHIEAFAFGLASDELVTEIAGHIEECPRCQEILESFDHCPIPLSTDLKSLGTEGSFSKSSNSGQADPANGHLSRQNQVPSDLLNLAHSVLNTDISSANASSFDSGKRIAKALTFGPVRLGKFSLTEELGAGEFGYVFKAFDTELQRNVAIKILRAGSLATDEEVERFFQEARSIAGLNHPGIVSLYDSVKSETGDYYLVTEFISGVSLGNYLKDSLQSVGSDVARDSHNHIRFAVSRAKEIAESLHYAHRHGVVHRDVKPSNILLDQNGRCHLTDFGLAKLEIEDTLTADGQILGTPAYMSPEQAAGNSHLVDARSDIFSLGVILYQMLTGQRPFQGDHRMVLLQVLEFEPPFVRKLNPQIPRDLETICHKAMEKNPKRRYQTAQDLADDLERFEEGLPVKARRIGVVESCLKWCKKFPLVATLLISAPVSLFVGLVYLMNLTTHLVHQTALNSVRMEADMLETINDFYSEEVVGRLDWKEMKVTHHYTTIDQSLPLPFTFMIDASERITSEKKGMQVRVYSAYPWRESGGPKNTFQTKALEILADKLEEKLDGKELPSYHQFQETEEGGVLLYARAQVMRESCVKCHNDHEDSPKRDWKEGDLAGVLAITRPLQDDVENIQSGLKSASYVVLSTTALLVGLSLLGIWGIRTKRASLAKQVQTGTGS